MSTPDSESSVVRFGVFEADLRSGELRKQGLKVRLAEQPFQLLAILLASPRRLITRDELRQRLWPVDTFVDFDRGLNKAINRLREALGDSALRAVGKPFDLPADDAALDALLAEHPPA